MNKTKQFLCVIIDSGRYSYESLFSKLDLFFLFDRISESDYIELSEKVKKLCGEEAAADELEG